MKVKTNPEEKQDILDPSGWSRLTGILSNKAPNPIDNNL